MMSAIAQLQQWAENLLQDTPNYFLVEIKINPGNNIKVFVDADNGAAIDRLARLNRALHKQIMTAGLFPENDFSLEISSAGLEKPLKLLRQYQKNKGRKVEVILEDGNKQEGILKEALAENIVLEKIIGTGKNKETKTINIPFTHIKNTTVCIVF